MAATSAADHPRTRGRDQGTIPITLTQQGSPTHTWTRQLRCLLKQPAIGITHAHVDETRPARMRSSCSRDHPRTRGRDNCASWAVPAAVGSPTHTWTRRHHHGWRRLLLRITHARVDETWSRRQPPRRRADHPRTRGRDWKGPPPMQDHTGSPTHTWTRRRGPLGAVPRPGITHARVDETAGRGSGGPESSDHPRTRGRDGTSRNSCLSTAGSPTHAWTRLLKNGRPRVAVRITHARVDETLVSKSLISHHSSFRQNCHRIFTPVGASASHSHRPAAVQSRRRSLQEA
jgi:hypothetical protein